jgi:hypothetical protein
MRPLRLPTLLLAVTAVTACGGTAASRGAPMAVPDRFQVTYRHDAPVMQDTLPITSDQAWAVLPAVYQELGLPGAAATNTPDARVFITPHMRIRGALFTGRRNSEFLDCGVGNSGVPRADTHSVNFLVITRLRPLPGNRVVLESMLDGLAKDQAMAGTEVECGGTGKLEEYIAQLVLQKARARG